MPISKRLRYEVLRRDNHTCQYCGGESPDVKLTVDHVIPVALGGGDEPSNLVAACKDCNTGKSSVPPGAPLVEKVSTNAAAYAGVLTHAMTKVRAQMQEEEAYLELFLRKWMNYGINGGESTIPLPAGWETTIRRWHKMGVPIELIQASIEAMVNKYDQLTINSHFRYMCGIVWNRIRDNEVPYHIAESEVAVYTQKEHHEDLFIETYRAYETGYKHGESGRPKVSLDEALELHMEGEE